MDDERVLDGAWKSRRHAVFIPPANLESGPAELGGEQKTKPKKLLRAWLKRAEKVFAHMALSSSDAIFCCVAKSAGGDINLDKPAQILATSSGEGQ